MAETRYCTGHTYEMKPNGLWVCRFCGDLNERRKVPDRRNPKTQEATWQHPASWDIARRKEQRRK